MNWSWYTIDSISFIRFNFNRFWFNLNINTFSIRLLLLASRWICLFRRRLDLNNLLLFCLWDWWFILLNNNILELSNGLFFLNLLLNLLIFPFVVILIFDLQTCSLAQNFFLDLNTLSFARGILHLHTLPLFN